MKKYLIILLCTVVFISAAPAQEVSEKQEMAVFSLSYSNWYIPTGALGMVDNQIIEVLTNIGRFNVKGLEFRLSAGDVNDFIDTIKKVNEANMVIDEKYKLGEAVFTEADFEEIVGSFIVVVPSLTYYDSIVKDSGNGAVWEVELRTSFSFILVRDSSVLAQFSIDTYGTGETQADATLEAAEAVSGQLEYELRSIEEFKLKSGIIEVLPGGNVIMELGADMGISRGDEFSIVSATVLDSGHTIRENTGLIVVSDVQQDVSFGKVIYSKDKVSPGNQLAEVPRAGSDLSVYGNLLVSIDDFSIKGGLIGVKTVFSRGFYDIRPFAGFEIPVINNSVWFGLPISMYFGGELMWYFGRLQLEPSLALGLTGIVPLNENEDFILSHIGGKAGLTANWMFTDNMKFFLEGGYTHWFTWLSACEPFGGIFSGLGVTFKL